MVIIGGLASARRAAEYGAKVALIENKKLGGTCVNLGCVPKKVIWNAANLADGYSDYSNYGFNLPPGGGDITIDWKLFKERRDNYISRLNKIYETNLEKSKIQLVQGSAKFVSPTEVNVNNSETFEANKILIATGGYPRIPNIPGASLGISRFLRFSYFNSIFYLANYSKSNTVMGFLH